MSESVQNIEKLSDKLLTNFPSSLNKLLTKLYKENNETIKKSLFDYQRYIFNYLVFTDARGILLYHSVGSGKTLTSISIAEEFRKLGRDIIILSSKSLQNNYKKEISTYLKMQSTENSNEEEQNIINQYKFVTSNAKNMIQSLDDKLTSFISKFKKDDDSLVSLDNKIIIIDEAHNLLNSIVNGSKIANEFYDIIMNAKNIKLILMTGTPIINNPFEISVAFNMIYGKIKNNNTKKDYYTILPEYYTDFQKYFIDQSTNSIKNVDKFKNRIFGLVSYYGDMYNKILKSIKEDIKEIKTKDNYPDRLPIKIETIEMSLLQNIEYMKARDIEKKETSKFYGRNEIIHVTIDYDITGGSIVKEKNNVSTSYRIKSRQLSNIYIPDVHELTIHNFNKYSPKLVKVFDNIKKNHKNQISLVYSTFIEYGLNSFINYLKLNNYTDYLEDSDNNSLHYALFSGQQSMEEREKIVKLCNSEENKNGSLISILLISKSGAEGLDLKNIRSVHILEPYWNYSLIEQIIARAVRYKSHDMLPKNQQNVQTYIYLSDYNSEFLKKEKEKLKEVNSKIKNNKLEFTTDINIFKNAIKNQELIQQFLKTIASTSIECKFLNKQNSNGTGINFDCFNCLPNNKMLYYPDIAKDIELSNYCIKSNSITAEEIIINGEKYYYQVNKENNLNIFKFNNILNGYQLINDKEINDKIEKIINKN